MVCGDEMAVVKACSVGKDRLRSFEKISRNICAMSKVIVFLLVSLGAFANSDSCDKSKCVQVPNHYLDLGCTPITEADGCCPVRFECPEIPKDGKCHHRGKSYNVGDEVPENEHPHCKASCRCHNIGDHIDFNCANIECPDLFHRPPPHCVRQVVPEQCCAKYECDMAKIAEISETKCYLDGQKYVKSEAMYPESHSCHSCVCDTGFDNKTIADSPHCSKIDCNIEFHYGDRLAAGCIPIYYKDSNCCPISWRCPESSDTVTAKVRSTEESTDPKMTCKFGRLTLEIGDELNSEQDNVSCTCAVPPQPHCIQKAN